MPSKIATFYYAKENNNSNTDLNKKNFTTFD